MNGYGSTLQDDYKYITTSNVEFQRNRDRWEFLMNSYEGGDTYRNAGYLTRYQLESNSEYQQRLNTTPLDNHCQNVVQVYTSFLFREEPERDYGSMVGRQDVEDFIKDADLDGRSLNAFMKDVATWSSVFGACWILLSKPSVGASTLGAEQALGVRPYVNILTPLVVMDWTWERQPNGRYELSYFKYIEEVVNKTTTVREWTRDSIKTWVMNDEKQEASLVLEEVNQLGKIPAVIAYNRRSITRGIGSSDIADVADLQKQIYQFQSEIEQSVRLDGHPSLVVSPTTQYGSGAGAVIVMPDDLDPGLKPYVLNHDGANIASIHASITQLVEAIDRISNTGNVRATTSRTLSGVAMEVEMSLLNARLSEKADGLELAEEQMWKLFAEYQGAVWDGYVDYPNSFNIRDTQREFQQLQIAKNSATDPRVLAVIDHEIVELLGEDPDLVLGASEYLSAEQLPQQELFEPHKMIDPATGEEYIARTEQEHLSYSDLGYVHQSE